MAGLIGGPNVQARCVDRRLTEFSPCPLCEMAKREVEEPRKSDRGQRQLDER
jgi:hypothetical protein